MKEDDKLNFKAGINKWSVKQWKIGKKNSPDGSSYKIQKEKERKYKLD